MNEDYTNWRADRVPNDVRDIVKKHYSVDMKPHDATALFWYVRSHFYFDLNFNKMNEFLLIRYEDFAMNPNKFLIKIYEHIGHNAPEGLVDNTINSKSIHKGKDVILSPDIEELCETLYQQNETEFSLRN